MPKLGHQQPQENHSIRGKQSALVERTVRVTNPIQAWTPFLLFDRIFQKVTS